MASTADYVVDTIRSNYPDLQVPFHSRWRHFVVQGRDLWKEACPADPDQDAGERTRSAIDLAVTSVLLDAGAGPQWRYRDSDSGEVYNRSEGLAVASFKLFFAGTLSSDPQDTARADAESLRAFDAAALAQAFQVGPDNPLEGLEGRALLLSRLGQALKDAPSIFGADTLRPGHLYDYLRSRDSGDTISAADLLELLLHAFESIWPGREVLQGHNLGDVWRHPLNARDDAFGGLVPFHKLSQWLTYSLIEPLTQGGLKIVDLESLTGLAEYRNGGLLIDMGVLVPRDERLLQTPLAVDSEAVVEWRALTVALLDRLAEEVRVRLDRSSDTLPLASVLEGGTWSAGRRAAKASRGDGGPPISIISDGTVF